MPTALDSFTTRSAGQTVAAAHVNNLQDAMLATEKVVVGPVWYNVKGQYAATGDGVADDTAEIQAAIDAAAAAGGGVVFVPEGTYLCDAAKLDLDGTNVELRGAGAGATVIKVTGGTQVGLDIAANRVKVRDLSLQHATNTHTAGAAIRLTSGGYADIDGVTFYGGWYRNIECIDGYAFTVGASCRLFDHLNTGIWHGQTTDSDRGDSVVEACTIDTGSGGATYGIFWESGGGLRVLGTKILAHANAIMADIKTGVATQGLYVSRCSIENFTSYGIRVKRASGTPTFGFVEIIGNQLDGTGDGISLESAGVSQAKVLGNNIRVSNTKTGINFGAAVSGVECSGNSLHGASVGIAIAADAQVTIGLNAYYGCTTNITDASGQDGTFGAVQHLYRVALASTTSTVSYTDVCEIGVGDYRTVMLELTFDLILGSVGRASRVIRKMLNKETSTVTVTAIEDTAAGAVFDVQFDTATDDVVKVGIKKNSATGDGLLGQIHVRMLGAASHFKDL